MQKLLVVVILFLTVTSLAAGPTTAEVRAKQRADAMKHLPQVKERFEKLQSQLQGNEQLQSSPYMQLDLAILQRFLQRIESPTKEQKQLPEWDVEQLNELDYVLDDANRLLTVRDPSMLRVPKSLVEEPELHGDT